MTTFEQRPQMRAGDHLQEKTTLSTDDIPHAVIVKSPFPNLFSRRATVINCTTYNYVIKSEIVSNTHITTIPLTLVQQIVIQE